MGIGQISLVHSSRQCTATSSPKELMLASVDSVDFTPSEQKMVYLSPVSTYYAMHLPCLVELKQK